MTWVTPGVGRAPRRRGSDQFTAPAANNDPGIVCLSKLRQPTIRSLLERADTESLVGNHAIHVGSLSPRCFFDEGFRLASCTATFELMRNEEALMVWTTPTLVEICIGLEINGYLPAEF